MQQDSITKDYLFLGTHGHVVALDKRDGRLVWDTSLPKTGYQVVALLVEDGFLLCGTAGRAFALDPLDGRVIWENELPGLGAGVVALATMQQALDGIAPAAAQQATNDASAATTTT